MQYTNCKLTDEKTNDQQNYQDLKLEALSIQ